MTNSTDISIYKRTFAGTYLCLFLQAFCINSPALLFVTLRTRYGLSYAELGGLAFVMFVVQIAVDVALSPAVDKYGFRPFLRTAPMFSILGIIIFVFAPMLMSRPYPLFVVGIVVISMACGILEVIVSPIVDNLPTPNKAKAMSKLHGMYGVGQILTVVCMTLLLLWLGSAHWQIVMALFILLPLLVLIVCWSTPVIDSRDNGRNIRYRDFLTSPIFFICLLAIFTGAVNENIMAQWTSAFFESQLGLPKVVGDLVAVCAFAVFFTSARLLYGAYGQHIKVGVVCIIGSVLSGLSYTILAFEANIVLAVLACAMCGVGVALMWPGVLTIATELFDGANTKLFGTLSAAGDLGGAVGPFVLGLVADRYDLSRGMTVGIVSCALCLVSHILLLAGDKKRKNA